jgi:hypothetical protein
MNAMRKLLLLAPLLGGAVLLARCNAFGGTSSDDEDSGAAVESGVESDARTAESGPGMDGSIPPRDAQAQIACGSATCSGPGALCCRGVGTTNATCEGGACNSSSDVRQYCDDSTDCPSESPECCVQFKVDANNVLVAINCVATCSGGGNSMNERACSPTGTNECHAGESCVQLQGFRPTNPPIPIFVCH